MGVFPFMLLFVWFWFSEKNPMNTGFIEGAEGLFGYLLLFGWWNVVNPRVRIYLTVTGI